MYLQYNKSNLVLQMPNLHRLRYLHVYVFCNTCITITILIVMIHAKFDERLSIIIYTCISVSNLRVPLTIDGHDNSMC